MAESVVPHGPDANKSASDPADYKALADYLKFARDQIEQDRKDFNHKFDWTIKFLAFLLVAVGLPIGFIGFKSLDQLMTELRDTTKAETDAAKVQREAMRESLQTMLVSIQQTVQNQRDTLQSSLAATKEQLKTSTQAELDNVRDAVNKRVDTEFKSDNIAAVVRGVAEERTQKELTGIIHSETSALVAKGIQEAQPSIQKAVEDQTRDAVKAMEPTVAALVKTATDDQVSKSVTPIQNQMAAYSDFIRMGNLTTLARGDDRNSFDYLVQVAIIGNKPESSNLQLRQLAEATALAIIQEHWCPAKFSRSAISPDLSE
jgi:hypothetical protein